MQATDTTDNVEVEAFGEAFSGTTKRVGPTILMMTERGDGSGSELVDVTDAATVSWRNETTMVVDLSDLNALAGRDTPAPVATDPEPLDTPIADLAPAPKTARPAAQTTPAAPEKQRPEPTREGAPTASAKRSEPALPEAQLGKATSQAGQTKAPQTEAPQAKAPPKPQATEEVPERERPVRAFAPLAPPKPDATDPLDAEIAKIAAAPKPVAPQPAPDIDWSALANQGDGGPRDLRDDVMAVTKELETLSDLLQDLEPTPAARAVQRRQSVEQAETTIHGSIWSERLRGMGTNDLLRGLMGHDSIDGGEGDDILVGGTGNDTLRGGEGFDTAVMLGNAQDYALGVTTTGNPYLSHRATGEVDILVGVEFVQFSDGVIAVGDLPTVLPINPI